MPFGLQKRAPPAPFAMFSVQPRLDHNPPAKLCKGQMPPGQGPSLSAPRSVLGPCLATGSQVQRAQDGETNGRRLGSNVLPSRAQAEPRQSPGTRMPPFLTSFICSQNFHSALPST